MKHKYPFRRVISADLQTGGQSVLKPGMPLGSIWYLTLECGHTVDAKVSYYPPTPDEKPRRGWYRRRRPDAAKPAPKRVHCELCQSEPI